MSYSLLRETKVIVVYEGRVFDFDAHANVSAGLSYQEYKSNRRTLHRKTNYPTSRVTMQDPISISLAVNLTNNKLESAFLDWLGMENSGDIWSLPFESKAEPIMVEVFLINQSDANLWVQNVYINAVDFTLEKSMPLLNINMEGAYIKVVNDFPQYGTLSQGEILPYSPLIVSMNSQELPAVMGASVSFQQQCSWREARTIHQIGDIYHYNRAYINEMNVSATINAYYIKRYSSDKLLSLEPEYDTPITIYNKYISVDFPSTRITKRLDVSDVYTIGLDIIPTENSEPVTIKLIGEERNA